MHRTLAALVGTALLLGASLAQAEVVTLSDSQLDGVSAGGSISGVAAAFNANGYSFNGSFNDFSTNNGNITF